MPHNVAHRTGRHPAPQAMRLVTLGVLIMMASTFSTFAPSAHHIQREGLGYRGVLTVDQLRKAVPAAFADAAHDSRSARYAYIPTSAVIEGMRAEGFLPVKAVQAGARDESKAGHGKHMIRFRREDQLHQPEAREVVMINSHDGSSAYKLSAGLFRLVCSNGLVVGREDVRQTVRHSGNVLHDVIEGATRIIDDFDRVTEDMETMKAVTLEKPLMLAFANAAIEARFDVEEKPVTAEQILRARRTGDMGADLWTVFNRVQENVVRGGITGFSKDAQGRTQRRKTREVKGIDQNDSLNRALWRLATEVAKIAA
jgi:hypothetical protein